MASRLIEPLQAVPMGKLFMVKQQGNRAESIEVLAKHGLRLATHREALADASSFANRSGEWFYLAEEHFSEPKGVRGFGSDGQLYSKPYKTMSIDQKVAILPGNGPLTFMALASPQARFLLDAETDPSEIAPIMVGARLGSELAALQPGVVIPNRDYANGKRAFRKIASTTHPEIAAALEKVFRN